MHSTGERRAQYRGKEAQHREERGHSTVRAEGISTGVRRAQYIGQQSTVWGGAGGYSRGGKSSIVQI